MKLFYIYLKNLVYILFFCREILIWVSDIGFVVDNFKIEVFEWMVKIYMIMGKFVFLLYYRKKFLNIFIWDINRKVDFEVIFVNDLEKL